MKVIILAGGWGTRLGQHTDWIPKPMVQIGDKPMLWHIMKIYAYHGYNDFIVSAGVKSHIIKEYFLNYEAYSNDFTRNFSTGQIEYHSHDTQIDWRVSVIDTGINTAKGARIKRLEKHLDKDINMVTYGDGLADVAINKLADFHASHNKLLTITGVHPPARFGEIREAKSLVTSFSEKPQTSVGLINGGFMVFRSGLLDYLNTHEDCDLEYDVLEKLTEQGEVMVYKHEGRWECLDHERDLLYLNSLWNSTNAFWKVWE
jgi:glucose-1-phosphate cytidylyltransferase